MTGSVRVLKSSGKKILPLCVDLAHPTPAAGWENREYASFLSRCAGHFDTVMMLAVLHHLLLRNQIPLDRIAVLCSNLTTRHLILEWVPASDPKFQELLRGRDAIYGHITEAAFREEFAVYFTFRRRADAGERAGSCFICKRRKGHVRLVRAGAG